LLEFAFHFDVAVHVFNNALGECQTEARVARMGVAARWISSVKTVENPRQGFGRDAWSVVADGN
jgi:hypothetical protein